MFSWLNDRDGVPRDSGLTLVELMVASTVSMILIVSVYSIYSISARGFRVQEQTMGAMQQARFGLGQLQRDISSAGFLATPNSRADSNVCPKPSEYLPGIVFATGGAVANVTSNTNVYPQQITLLGAFWNPTLYFTRKITGNQVVLQGAEDGAPFPQTREEFDQIFKPKRFLRIVNADQFETYVPIASADYDNRQITLTTIAPVASPPNYCGVQGFGVGLEVNVVGVIRYTLQADPSETGKVDLVRQELDGTNASLDALMTQSTVRIAEYVADLQFFDFVVDVDRTRRMPVQQQYATLDDIVSSSGQQLDLTGNARPQDLRFVTVKLTTRTRDEDESRVFIPRTGVDKPLDQYEVDAAMKGAAGTVSLAVRVGLPSFLVRNVK